MPCAVRGVAWRSDPRHTGRTAISSRFRRRASDLVMAPRLHSDGEAGSGREARHAALPDRPLPGHRR